MQKVPSLKVPKETAQHAIEVAKKMEIYNPGLKVGRTDGCVLVPLKAWPTQGELKALQETIPRVEISHFSFVEKIKSPKTLIEALENKLPPHLLASIPRSIDIVGEVAVIEIPPDLEEQKNLIGRAILEIHKNVRTVLAKASAVRGVRRLREFEIIAGVGGTETMHKEHGCIYYVDLSKVYFSPRLSHEHRRVAKQVGEGETVVDMFAGVGPFSIKIAKNHNKVMVYAIDINPDAILYLERNIIANKVQGKVLPIFGDARMIIQEKLGGVADRVIMNLPENAIEYVHDACNAIKSEGGVIHYYEFSAEPDPLEKTKARLWNAVTETGRRIEKFLNARLVRPTAPHEFQVVVDALIR